MNCKWWNYRDWNLPSCQDQVLLVLNEFHSHKKTESWILKFNSKATWECPQVPGQFTTDIYSNITISYTGKTCRHTYWFIIISSLISVYWQTFFDAGALAQTNSLGVPLSRAWRLHPIAIAMAVYPHTLTETHTKQWQTANTLTLCHTYKNIKSVD